MSEELQVLKPKTKRDIFRFNGEKPTAINLEHVSMITIDKKRISFNFHTNGIFVDMDSEESAQNIFEQILRAWADVVE